LTHSENKPPDKKKRIEISPQPGCQYEFCSRQETEVGFLGDAGSGKSYALLLDAARYVHVNDYRAIVFRKSYPDLEYIIDLGRKIFGPLGGKYNKNDHKFNFPSGAQVFVGYLQHAEDVYNYQGRDYAYIGFDEVTHIPIESYLYMFSRLRSPNPFIVKRIRCTANPDGPYVMAYYDRFVVKLSAGETKFFTGSEDLEVEPEKGISRCWIESKRAQNKILMENDPAYETRLDSLPEEKRNALKYGIWAFTDDPLILVKSSWLNKARTGQNTFVHGHYSLGMDFAENGGDKTIVVKGCGNRVLTITHHPNTDHAVAAKIVFDEMLQYGWQINAAIDAIGSGAGVYTFVKDKYPSILDRVIPLKAKDRFFDEAMKYKYANRIKFANLRSQVYWRLREDFEKGDIDLSLLAGNPELNKLIGDLSEIRWSDDKGFIQIEEKAQIRKRLKRSTDHADALAYWNWARHLKIELPSIDMDDRERNSIDYGIYRDDSTYSDDLSPGEGRFTTGDAGSWA